ncbi:IS110 family RNA-guided transposase [Acidiphilium acidophilum]|uniref:IS110 family transposase n=1 Tax=Acidiphilium acidophilum TaxID=76588 RepID=A0AAW9DJU3_ACIAO|nr:IS110 family transposase [Acidiphilium acidophilum]MDX5929294.1 IS110 family transposase [Acidiphilium acidophilum]GBR75117.1 transposase [Acidiphilium acidophilum DSM 700]
MDNITFVGLDVHKATVCAAVAESGRDGEVRQIGVFENRPDVLKKMVTRLGKNGRRLSFCYEAGPCGYGLQRLLRGAGHECVVVAPSLIPIKAGDRVKTDRRDAMMLAKLHRAGELTAIWVPDQAHEAMRDLVRARATAVRVLGKARQHLQGFLLRHERVYHGSRAWTVAYQRWLTTVKFEHPAQQIVLQDYIHAVQDAEARRDRLTGQIEELLPNWSMAPVVAALQAMRGVALVAAVTVVAEVGDFRRFANPRQLMAYLGLVPSEHSSGGSVRRGGITKAGNALARRVLIEGAWTYRLSARVSRKIHDRLEPLSTEIRDIAWNAQVRLCARYRRLVALGKPKVVVTTAIAREMVGFIWAISRIAQPNFA